MGDWARIEQPPDGREINLSRIPADRRREVWDWLQSHHPDLADWLRDPLVRAMKQAFDAELIIEIPDDDTTKETLPHGL